MRIKHLFYLLLALPLAFAACETESDDVNKTPEVKEPVLKLTSNAEVDVTAAGGEFEITYTLENKKEGVELTATCEADWVSVTAGDKVKVVIEANEGEAREAKVVVAYEAQKFEVTYKQAAKEQGEEPVKPEDPEKPVLTLTSEATLEFTAEGGDGEITYTLENAVEGVELAATCEAAWVTELKAEEKVTFKVAANDGEARETKVVVAYGEQNFEVAVKQAAKAVVEPETVNVEAKVLLGEYYVDETLDSDIYYVILSDVLIDEETEEFVPGKYYNLAVYAEKYTGEWKETMTLPVGVYNLDMNETYAAGTIDYVESVFVESTSASEESVEALFDAAELTVTEAGVTLKATIEGVEHVVTFVGEQVIYNYSEPEDPETPVDPLPGETKEFNASYFGGQYYNLGAKHNYYIVLSDVEVTGSYAVEGATYYYFDIYSNVANDDLSVPNGTYIFDSTNSYAPGTFTKEYGYGFLAAGADNTVRYLYAEGSTLTVSDGKIVAELIMTDGTKHIVTYEGDLSLAKFGGPLTEDLEINASGWDVVVSYYGQYYSNATDNWYVEIFEDADTENGRYFVLDLLADYNTSVDHSGTFTGSDSMGVNTFLPGVIEDGYLASSWYAELTDGAVSGRMAPLTGGTITVTLNDDGTETYVFDCTDDQGYKITGTVSCVPYEVESYAMKASTSLVVKKSNVELPKKQVVKVGF